MATTRNFFLLLTIGLLILNVSALAFYWFYFSPQSTNINPPAPSTKLEPEPTPVTDASTLNDEYYSIHFNYSDAVEVCKLEAQSRNSNMIQLSVNDLSSRFNPIDKMYLIKLDSHVGTPLLYDEKAHTCHIDPKTQGVAFYQEITRRTAIRPNQ